MRFSCVFLVCGACREPRTGCSLLSWLRKSALTVVGSLLLCVGSPFWFFKGAVSLLRRLAFGKSCAFRARFLHYGAGLSGPTKVFA